MNLSPLPIQKFFGNDGRPLVGGKLFTYLSGTSTKVATYTDAGGLTQNTNPIVLDYRGECNLWIDPQQSYTFVLAPSTDTDPPTSPIWTVNAITAGPVSQDNAATDTGSVNNIALSMPQITSPVAFTRIVFKVSYTNTGPVTITINGGTAKALKYQNTAAFVGGEILADGIYEAVYDGAQWQLQGPAVAYWITAAEIAAGVTPTNYAIPSHDQTSGIIFPERYGLSPDTVADQSASLGMAIDVAQQLSGSTIWLPPGDIYCNIDFTAVRGVRLVGSGRDATQLRNWGASAVITLDNTSGDCKLNVFESFRIINRDEATYTAADGIYITGSAVNENDFHVFRDIEITNMRYGFYFTNRSVWCSFEDVHAYSNVDGFRAVATENISAFAFRQCRFGANTGYGMYVSKASGDLLMTWTFDNVTLEKNGLNGLRVSGAASGIGGWVFNGMYCEENTTSISASSTNPRKANIFIDAAYCIGLTINGWQSFGTPSGDQIDWHFYMDSACTNASGTIIAPRWGSTATIGAYTLTTGMSVINDFGTVGSSVAPRDVNLIFNDLLGSSETFTPSLTFGGAAVGMTYSNQIGRVVRFGNMMSGAIYISLTAAGSSTGSAVISGLPVASANITNLRQAVTIRGDQFQNTADVLQAYVEPNTQTITLERFFDGVATALTDADFGNSTAISINFNLLLS